MRAAHACLHLTGAGRNYSTIGRVHPDMMTACLLRLGGVGLDGENSKLESIYIYITCGQRKIINVDMLADY